MRVVVQNSVWLPSYVTKKALEKKIVRELVCEITLPDDARLVSGKSRESAGQLEGRAYTPVFLGFVDDVTADRQKVEWVVQAPSGGTIQLIARHPRAGVVRAEVKL